MAGRRGLQGVNYPIRTSTRNRVAKQFPDYTDCSFSESEPYQANEVQTRRNDLVRSSRGGRGTATKRKANGLSVNSDRSSPRGGRQNGIQEIYVLFYAFNLFYFSFGSQS